MKELDNGANVIYLHDPLSRRVSIVISRSLDVAIFMSDYSHY